MVKKISQLDPLFCTGCGACFNVCPAGAIGMRADAEGFLTPQIDESLCTNCGLCAKVCPAMTPPKFNGEPEFAYAVWASDEIRFNSSSGGMFTLLANSIFDRGGYVAGAAYADNFKVKHILISKSEDLDKLRNSKYVQCDTGEIFKEVKAALEAGAPVLFSGCPCQVAGLYGYLGKEYSNLITADIICHGAPSPLALEKFLEIRERGRKIDAVHFRNKAKTGWSTTTLIEFDNGAEYRGDWQSCTYFQAFLSGLSTRRSCGVCAYAKSQRVADFTLGDFWNIHFYNADYDDKKGTSLVLVNTEKAAALFDELKPQMKLCEPVPISFAQKYNMQLSEPEKSHNKRAQFFKLMHEMSFDAAVHLTLPKKYDIAQIGWWFNQNFGGALTNFALHEALKDMGYSVAMPDWPKNCYGMPAQSLVRDFAKEHYDIVEINSPSDLTRLNDMCGAFVVGSDQVWSYNCAPHDHLGFFLDFVDDSKKKISYASSFGMSWCESPPEIRKQTAFHLSRFDAISVREDMAVKICDQYFGLSAERVLDPVFICDKKRFIDLAAQSKLSFKNKFLFAYILDPTPDKRRALEKIAAEKKLEIKVILDAQYEDPALYQKNRETIGAQYVIDGASLYDYLYLLVNGSFIVTDSFHGACFSIIFEKDFAAISNGMRGVTRFETLFNIFPMLKNHWASEAKELLDNAAAFSKIDYGAVAPVLAAETERCKKWLYDALNKPKTNVLSTYDMLTNRLGARLDELENANEQGLHELWEKLNAVERIAQDAQNKADTILRSRSYKLGRAITFIPRKIRGLFRRLKRCFKKRKSSSSPKSTDTR